MSRLAALRSLLDILAEMHVALDARDADRLEDLEAVYRLTSSQFATLPVATPEDPEAELIAELSREVLNQQTQLELLVQPWMADLKLIFRERRNEEVLASAYRQGG